MAAPLIGICGRVLSFSDEGRRDAYSSSQPYSRAIARAGGLPVLIPPLPTMPGRVDELLDQLDGILLPGGGDVDPRIYGAKPATDSLYGIVPEHDELDLALAHAVVERDIPMLAVCRGMQILNIAFGGTLVQDLEVDGHWMREHDVHLTPGSLLAAATGTTTMKHCQSVHHQGIGRLSDHLKAVGHADDGLLEAVEHRSATWVVGTQWHPEDSVRTDPAQQALFDELVRRAAARP